MKITALTALALVALGMTAKAAAVTRSANTERVDYRCYYNCVKQGRDDCDWLCDMPGPDKPEAARATGSLHKRDYRCYYMCMRGCADNDSACKDQCQLDCSGDDNRFP